MRHEDIDIYNPFNEAAFRLADGASKIDAIPLAGTKGARSSSQNEAID
jgi:hypothetical protein